MTQLTPTLYAVEVPSDHETKISILNWLCFRHKRENIWHTVLKLEGNFKILGEVTKDEISFDVKKLPEMSLTIKEANLLLNENDKIDFRSLLQSKGIYFENPIEKPDFMDGTFDDDGFGEVDKRRFKKELAEWQESENKVIKGKLIILEKL